VRDDRVVQVDRKSNSIRDAAGVRTKFGVSPQRIPDYLALVGDAADGYPGIAGIGPKGAVSLIERYGGIEDFPPEALGKQKNLALLFKKLATLREDAPLFKNAAELKWLGVTDRFGAIAERVGDNKLAPRAERALQLAQASMGSPEVSLPRKRKAKASTNTAKRGPRLS
jgi:5'-3' exonuclease